MKVGKKMWKRFFRGMEKFDINIEQLKYKQLQGAQIVDVRSLQEFMEWHIDGAINLPDYKINKKNCMELLKDKNREIVVYCLNGGRSRKAYYKLKKLGYENVYNLYEGIVNFL